MVSIKLVVANDKTLVGLGDCWSPDLLISLGGLVLIGSLVYHNVKGGILIGISVLTCIFWRMDESYPEKIMEWPSLETGPEDYIDLR